MEAGICISVLGRQGQEYPWGSLTKQTSLIDKPQANERPCMQKQTTTTINKVELSKPPGMRMFFDLHLYIHLHGLHTHTHTHVTTQKNICTCTHTHIHVHHTKTHICMYAGMCKYSNTYRSKKNKLWLCHSKLVALGR